MNCVLLNSYSSSSRVKLKTESDVPKGVNNKYLTWPRQQKRSAKYKALQIIANIKRERAVSQLNLNKVSDGDELFKRHDVEVDVRRPSSSYIFKETLKEGDKKLKSKINHLNQLASIKRTKQESDLEPKFSGTVTDLSINSPKNGSFRDSIFNENKLGVIRILKTWRLNSEISDKEGRNSSALSDSRSSFSSLNTLNEGDNISISSDSFSTTSRKSKYEHQHKVISSSQLIQLERPSNLPPKPVHEQIKHQKEYQKMVEAVKKKERDKDLILKKKQEARLKEEEKLAQSTYTWLNEILPNWQQMKNTKKTYNLWWNGLPPCIRGKIWSLTIGNRLKITKEEYSRCVQKSKEILKSGSKDSLELTENFESSVELIRLDISRTFPHLYIFQQGGPYYDILHSLLGAYVYYQPEVGYVQGMSFIAAVLLLNMEEFDAFICFANMLDLPCHKAFFTLDVNKMKCYYAAYNDFLRYNIAELWSHFHEASLTPDLYLVDWVYTLFSKSMNLDLACRIWDLVIRDGDEFIFRTALGVMHSLKDELLQMDFPRAAQSLSKLPEDLSADRLFKSISAMRMEINSCSYEDLVLYYEELLQQ